MKNLIIPLLALLSFNAAAQYNYTISAKNPFGRLNPEAPIELSDFEDLIGTCACNSVSRIDQNTWADTVKMFWTFKYILNGMAVQDETLKEDGTHSGSIRQYSSDSSKWFVHFFTSTRQTSTLSSWAGGKKDQDIVLYRKQPAPNGTEGYYRLTFFEISNDGFNWVGEWVNLDESIIYPTWRIFCAKIEDD